MNDMSWTHPRITVEAFALFLALAQFALALSVVVFIEDIAPVINWLTEPPSSAVLGPNHSGPR
jgi:hypothetical protein